MTLIDREIALDLVTLYQGAFVRVHALEQILKDSGGDWQSRLAPLLEEHERQTHDMFEKMRQLILHSDDMSSAVNKMLREFDKTDPEDSAG